MCVRYFILSLLISCLLSGCQKQARQTTTPASSPTAPVPSALSAAEAKAGFGSPEALTKMLERRWPIAAVQEFCIPERRHNNAYQNLVALGDVWRGELYQGVATGFDKIGWYATTKEGRADQYSLEVYRGKDFWLLEIGSEKSIEKPPEFSPDPTKPWFVGNK
jgi:hypothetical protein